jgi:hypothetical protein
MESPSPVPSPAGLVVKNRIEDLLVHLGQNANTIVADPDLPKVFGGRSQGRLLVASIRLRLSLGCRTEKRGGREVGAWT